MKWFSLEITAKVGEVFAVLLSFLSLLSSFSVTIARAVNKIAVKTDCAIQTELEKPSCVSGYPWLRSSTFTLSLCFSLLKSLLSFLSGNVIGAASLRVGSVRTLILFALKALQEHLI